MYKAVYFISSDRNFIDRWLRGLALARYRYRWKVNSIFKRNRITRLMIGN